MWEKLKQAYYNAIRQPVVGGLVGKAIQKAAPVAQQIVNTGIATAPANLIAKAVSYKAGNFAPKQIARTIGTPVIPTFHRKSVNYGGAYYPQQNKIELPVAYTGNWKKPVEVAGGWGVKGAFNEVLPHELGHANWHARRKEAPTRVEAYEWNDDAGNTNIDIERKNMFVDSFYDAMSKYDQKNVLDTYKKISGSSTYSSGFNFPSELYAYNLKDYQKKRDQLPDYLKGFYE